MRIKGFIKFLIVFVIIILIFISFVINFDKFTLSYNGKKEKCQNPYYIVNDKMDIIQQIKYLDSNSNIITDEQIIEKIKSSIQSNDIIKKVIIELVGINEEKIDVYIDKLYLAKEIKNITNLNTIYGDIIYIHGADFDLAFTLDFKNLVYKTENVYTDEYYGWQYKEFELETKEKIYNKVKDDLKNINITNFEPNSMYIKYFNGIYAEGDEEIFVVTDNTNNIIVEYEDNLERDMNINESVSETDSISNYNQLGTRVVKLTIGFNN